MKKNILTSIRWFWTSFTAITLFVASLLFLHLFIGAEEKGNTPLEVIKQSNQQVKEILDKHKIVDERIEAQLYRIIDGVTDYQTLSQQVTEQSCKKLTPQQCRTFNQIFVELLRVSSIKKMGRYRADNFDYLGEEINQDQAVVTTTAYYKKDKAELVYHLHKKDGKWMIINYVLDDIDTVRNYKKQFLRLFASETFDQVMDRLRKKIADYQKQNRSE